MTVRVQNKGRQHLARALLSPPPTANQPHCPSITSTLEAGFESVTEETPTSSNHGLELGALKPICPWDGGRTQVLQEINGTSSWVI